MPKPVRTALHWPAAQDIACIPKGRGVLLVPVPKQTALRGLARGARPEEYRDRRERV